MAKQMLAEAYAERLRGLGLAGMSVPGEDAIDVPAVRVVTGDTDDDVRIAVDLNVAYHAWCREPSVIRACHVIRREGAVDFSSVLDAYGIDWCGENEQLQVLGIFRFDDAVKAAWRLAHAAAAIEAMAYLITNLPAAYFRNGENT